MSVSVGFGNEEYNLTSEMKYEDMIDPPEGWKGESDNSVMTEAQVLLLGVYEHQYLHAIAQGWPQDRIDALKKELDDYWARFSPRDPKV